MLMKMQASAAKRRRVLFALRMMGIFFVIISNIWVFRFSVYSLPSFDGALNLITVRNMINGAGPKYPYFSDIPLDHYLQTSGVWFILTWFAMNLLGADSFLSWSIANFSFYLLLQLVFFSFLQSIGKKYIPFVFIVPLLPLLSKYGFGGYGELVVLSLTLLAIYLATSEKSSRRNLFASGLAVALALVTKVVGLIMIPFLFFYIYRRFHNNLGKYFSLGFFSTIFAWEFFRFLVSGPLIYIQYWLKQLNFISYYAIGNSNSESVTHAITYGISQRFSQLASYLHLNAWLFFTCFILINSIVIFIIFAVFRRNISLDFFSASRKSTSDYSNEEVNIHRILLIWVYSLVYFMWWFFLTPVEQTWDRRIFPGITAMIVSTILAVAFLYEKNMVAKPFFALFLVTILVVVSPHKTLFNLAIDKTGFDSEVESMHKLVSNVDAIYGYGWWSSPVVSLVTGKNLTNLKDLDHCSTSKEAKYLVWDYYAAGIVGDPPGQEDDRWKFIFLEKEGTTSLYKVLSTC